MTNHEKTPASTRTPRYTQPSNLPSARDTQGQPSRPTRGLFMASLTLSLAAALTACWSATPQPITSVTQTINEGFQVTNVEAFNTGVNSQAATGATASSSGISISFDQPVNRASVERSINIFDGEINPALNPKKITKLGLTSMCNGTWRIRNANTSPIAFTWDIRKDSEREDNDEHDDDDKHRKGLEQGTGMLPANADVMLQTSNGPHSLRLLVGNKNQQSKHATRTACTSSPMTFAWAADSKSVVASPKTALVLNKTYSVVVSTFAKNSSGSLALSVPYVSKVVVKENSSTSGTLVPGGSFTSKDGVVIGAPNGAISTPIQVFAEKVIPTSITTPIPEGISIVGNFYRVGASERTETDKNFEIKIPIPDGEPSVNLRVMILITAGSVTDNDLPDDQLIWYTTSLDGLENNKAIIKDSLLLKEGTIYTLIRDSNVFPKATNLTSKADSLPYVFECSLGRACPPSLESEAKAASLSHYEDFTKIMQLNQEAKKPILDKIIFSSCTKNNGEYTARLKTITICITQSNNTPEGSFGNTLRHEIFHSVQAIWVDLRRDDLRPARRWIIEATATAAEYSDETQMTRDTSKLIRKVTTVLDSGASQDPYRAQDFWIYFGRLQNQGLPILKNLFKTGLNSPKTDADNYFAGINGTQGLPQNYWRWSKNQAYEKTIDLWNQGNACRPDNNAINPDYTGQTLRLEATATSVSTPSPINVGSLQTRVIPIRFTNTDSRSVKVTLEATGPTPTPLKYKIYEGTVPTTQTDCIDDPEGTFQTGTKAEILETVTNKTELVIFVSNTDFVDPSSFTVKVEEVAKITTPNIKQQTPTGLQDLTGSVTLTARRGQAINTNLVFTNQGEIGSSMGYIIYPLGNQVTSGVSVASIRNPISTPTGTVSTDVWDSSLFRTRSGTLRHPDNLDTNNGENQAVIPIQATCPDAQVSLSETMTLVYTTGAMDDFGTPDDPKDDQPELEIFPITVKLDCVGQRISEIYFVKPDKSIVQWAMKAHGNFTLEEDYQQRCYPAPPRYVEAPIPDLHGLLVANRSVGIYLLTDDGSKWSLRRYRLDGPDPTEIMWDSQLISGPNQTVGTASLQSRLQSTDRDRSPEKRVTYFYSLGQFKKNRLQATGYFAGTLLTIAANGTVWGAGDDSFGQASGNGQAYQNGIVRTVPVLQQIPGPTNIIEVYGSSSYGMALSKTGDVWLWGSVHQCEQIYYGLTPRIIANIN